MAESAIAMEPSRKRETLDGCGCRQAAGRAQELGHAMKGSFARLCAQLYGILDTILDGVLIVDEHANVAFFNTAALKLFRWNESDFHKCSLFELFELGEDDWPRVSLDRESRLEVVARRPDGTGLACELSIAPIPMAGEAMYFVVVHDLTKQRSEGQALRYVACHDALTGLANRAFFLDELERQIETTRRRKRLLGLLLLDLDRFKSVNDTLGHAVGDQLLQAVAERIGSMIAKKDLLARLGGDEFAVLVTDCDNVDEIHCVAEAITRALAHPFSINGRNIYTGCSVGVTIFPFDENEGQELLKNADLALYYAKEQGRGNWQCYNASLRIKAERFNEIETELREALEQDALTLFYQAQFDLETGALSGAEALLRWHHPEKGWIAPASFISVAESSGLIVPLGKWIFERVCRQIADWNRSGLDCASIAINTSVIELQQPDFVSYLEETAAKWAVPLSQLELEITEGAFRQETMDDIAEALAALKARGAHLSIGDFGTGYSSLDRLKRLPVDKLKIHRSFVREMLRCQADHAIVHMVTKLGHAMNMQVLAEGVESSEQLKALREIGCDEGQGFLLARPLRAADFAKLLRARSFAAFQEQASCRAPLDSDNVIPLMGDGA